MNKKNTPYEAPQLTCVTFAMERGFAMSGEKKLGLFETRGTEQVESREDGGTWGNWF
ncbi:MAG: hypothetical protein SPL12_10025 [Bacteroidales bacterium]|nr:hypothetical protein [Bacteroidales bacterium]